MIKLKKTNPLKEKQPFSKSRVYQIMVALCSVAVTAGIGYVIVWAGNLNPAATPADTMKTLEDIYYELDKSAPAVSVWGLEPSAAPASTMFTLQEIYDKTPKFHSDPGTAVIGDVCNSATFYTDSATKLTGTRTACFSPRLSDTGQTGCWDASGNPITCGNAPQGQDAEYTAANSPATCDASFTDNGDYTVIDNCTGLQWKQCSQGQNNDATCSGVASVFNWANALAACEGLDFAGHTDWRLPNIKELISIVSYQNVSPAINTAYFPSTESDTYWSSTTSAGTPGYAWYVYVYNGGVGNYPKTYSKYVRCVRG